MENKEIKEKQEKVDKVAKNMQNVGCGIIALIILVWHNYLLHNFIKSIILKKF